MKGSALLSALGCLALPSLGLVQPWIQEGQNIWIDAQPRSGCTLLYRMLTKVGDRTDEGAFKLFEPCHKGDLVHHDNCSQEVESIFKCDFEGIEKLQFWGKDPFGYDSGGPKPYDAKKAKDFCLARNFRLVKTIRMNNPKTDALPLIDKVDNLKIVSIVRDPRQIYRSMKKRTMVHEAVAGMDKKHVGIVGARQLSSKPMFNDQKVYINYLCETMAETQEAQDPRFYKVRFEDLLANEQTSKDLFEFLGISYEDWLQDEVAQTWTRGKGFSDDIKSKFVGTMGLTEEEKEAFRSPVCQRALEAWHYFDQEEAEDEEEKAEDEEEKPDAEEEKPEAKEEKPEVEEKKPRVEEEKSEVEEEKPEVFEENPEVDEKPEAFEEKPEAFEEKPEVEEEKPEVEEEKPEVEEKKPEVEEEKPEVEEEKPEAFEEKPEAFEEKPEAFEEKPEVEEEKPEVEEEKPEVEEEKPEVEEEPEVKREPTKVMGVRRHAPPETRETDQNIWVYSQGRSGSTSLYRLLAQAGEILGKHPFQLFEPCHQGDIVHYENCTQEIEAIFRCDFDEIEKLAFWRRDPYNYPSGSLEDYSPQVASSACSSATMRIIKTIRMNQPIPDAIPVFSHLKNVKVVAIIRDPRAIYYSHKHNHNMLSSAVDAMDTANLGLRGPRGLVAIPSQALQYVRYLCSSMQQIKTVMMVKYPSFYVVKFEDLLKEEMTSQNLFKFLGLAWNAEMHNAVVQTWTGAPPRPAGPGFPTDQEEFQRRLEKINHIHDLTKKEEELFECSSCRLALASWGYPATKGQRERAPLTKPSWLPTM